MAGIRYTRHAHNKFEILRRLGFQVTPEQVEDTVLAPERVTADPRGRGRFIAQKRIAERHVLRVVYREEGETRVVITFYPGRRERYEVEI
ncbi:MAG: DUF4258 domain-containing protein [Armatimonadetes bacterium]|nr:DUF4258 domain-containing protein [Armatimonadota bacterium]